MTVIVRWTAPTDSNWTHSRIYSATSKTGSYSQLAQIAIGTYSYTDSAGSSSYWYKVSFWDGVNESSLSEPLQGGASANYCSLAELRKISNLQANEITDVDVLALMPVISKIVHGKIMRKIKLERLEGPVDGSNTIFYTSKRPLSDMDMDSDVDGDDVKIYYGTYDANNRLNYGSVQTVSSVDARGGRITMSTAPTTTTAKAGVYCTYGHTIEDIDYADVKRAATYFLAHYCSLKVKGETPNFEQIEAPYLRGNIAGSIGLPYDAWKYPFLVAGWNLLREILGKGTDGIGFRRVTAERSDA